MIAHFPLLERNLDVSFDTLFFIGAVLVETRASSEEVGKEKGNAWKGGDKWFMSQQEDHPWIGFKIQAKKVTAIIIGTPAGNTNQLQDIEIEVNNLFTLFILLKKNTLDLSTPGSVQPVECGTL